MKVISNNAILTNYIPGYLNQAIHFTGDDMGSDRAMMIVLLYVVIAITHLYLQLQLIIQYSKKLMLLVL